METHMIKSQQVDLVNELAKQIKDKLKLKAIYFISTDTYVGQTENYAGVKVYRNGKRIYEIILQEDKWRIFYPNQRRIATNYKNVTSYSVQRIVNYLEHDMGRI